MYELTVAGQPISAERAEHAYRALVNSDMLASDALDVLGFEEAFRARNMTWVRDRLNFMVYGTPVPVLQTEALIAEYRRIPGGRNVNTVLRAADMPNCHELGAPDNNDAAVEQWRMDHEGRNSTEVWFEKLISLADGAAPEPVPLEPSGLECPYDTVSEVKVALRKEILRTRVERDWCWASTNDFLTEFDLHPCDGYGDQREHQREAQLYLDRYAEYVQSHSGNGEVVARLRSATVPEVVGAMNTGRLRREVIDLMQGSWGMDADDTNRMLSALGMEPVEQNWSGYVSLRVEVSATNYDEARRLISSAGYETYNGSPVSVDDVNDVSDVETN